jgi:FtsH-binding integral membrane protein
MGPAAGFLILIAMGAAALVRVWSARRVRAGDRRAVPLLLFSTLIVALLLVGAAVWFAFRSPLIGVVLTIGALVIGGAWLRVSLDTARYGGPIRGRRDRMDDLTDSLERTYRALAAGLLGLGFVGAILGVMWLFARGRF